MPNVRQSFPGTLRYLTEQKPLKAHHLDRYALSFVQGCQAFFQDVSPFLKRQSAPQAILGFGIRPLKVRSLVPIIEVPQRQILPAIHAPVVCILENPGFRAAFGVIELPSLIENFKENVLHEIFRFSPIPQNSRCNLQNKTVVTVK